MADDRYSWLDEDAAERLLRGEPFGVPDAAAGDGRAEERARRLSAALNCVADPARLPAGTDEEGVFLSEAVVLAAYRETAADARRTGPAERGRSLFRLPRTTDGGRRSALGRPLRAGIAAALAGCALGGVAVAAGTGVLPTPFRHSVEPGPSGSAPVTGSAPSTSSGKGAGGTDGESPGGGHETNEHGGKSPGSGGQGDPKGLGGDRDEPAGGRDGTADGIPAPPGFGDVKTRGAAIELCRKYTTDTLDRRTRERLEAAAGGPATVDGHCARLLNGRDDNDAEGSRGGGTDSDAGPGASPGSGGSGPDAGPAPGSHADPYLGAGSGGASPPRVGSGRDGRAGNGDRGGDAYRPHRPLHDGPSSNRKDREDRKDRHRKDRHRQDRKDRRDRESRQGRQGRQDPAGHRDGRTSGAAGSRAYGQVNGRPAGGPVGPRASSPAASPAAPSGASRAGTAVTSAATVSPEAG